MSSTHEERTAAEQRENGIHNVILTEVDQISDSIRLLKFRIPSNETIKFLPGQWLDVYIPGVRQAGGFTITSTPKDAEPSGKRPATNGYLELAVQKSPKNTPAQWLWRDRDIIGQQLQVRVGGSFVWPPSGIDVQSIKKVVFVAGGVGINPLMSILSHLHQHPSLLPPSIRFLYTTRSLPSKPDTGILFYNRLLTAFASHPSPTRSLDLYLTEKPPKVALPALDIIERDDFEHAIRHRRLTQQDLMEALGEPGERTGVVAYVCGPAGMTDEVVGALRRADGMEEKRVLCEKWW